VSHALESLAAQRESRNRTVAMDPRRNRVKCQESRTNGTDCFGAMTRKLEVEGSVKIFVQTKCYLSLLSPEVTTDSVHCYASGGEKKPATSSPSSESPSESGSRCVEKWKWSKRRGEQGGMSTPGSIPNFSSSNSSPR
jgi:hypothetical protein